MRPSYTPLIAIAVVGLMVGGALLIPASEGQLSAPFRVVNLGDRFVARITLPQSTETVSNGTVNSYFDEPIPTRTPAATVLDLRENEIMYFDVIVFTGPDPTWNSGSSYDMSPISYENWNGKQVAGVEQAPDGTSRPAIHDTFGDEIFSLNIYAPLGNSTNFEKTPTLSVPFKLDGNIRTYEDGPAYAGARVGVPVASIPDHVLYDAIETASSRFAVSVSGCDYQWDQVQYNGDERWIPRVCGESYHSAMTNYLIHNGILQRQGTFEADWFEGKFLRDNRVNLSTPVELYKSGGDTVIRGTSTGDGFLARVVFPQAAFQPGDIEDVGDFFPTATPAIPLRSPAGTVVRANADDYTISAAITLYEDYGFEDYQPARDGTYQIEFYPIEADGTDGRPGYATNQSYNPFYSQTFITGNGDPSDDSDPDGEYGSGFRTVGIPASLLPTLGKAGQGNHYLVAVRDCNQGPCRSSYHSVTTNTMISYLNNTVGIEPARQLADRIEAEDDTTGIRTTATPVYVVTSEGTDRRGDYGFGAPFTAAVEADYLLRPDGTSKIDVTLRGTYPQRANDSPDILRTRDPANVTARMTVGMGPYIDSRPGPKSLCVLKGDDFFGAGGIGAEDDLAVGAPFTLRFEIDEVCAPYGEFGETGWVHLTIEDAGHTILTATNPGAAAQWETQEANYESACRAFIYAGAHLPTPAEAGPNDPTDPANRFYELADTLCSLS